MIFKLLLPFLLSLSLFAHQDTDVPHTHIIYTQEELKWLADNPTLTYAYDPDWKPFEWKNNIGLHTGIIADIFTLINEKTGIHFIPKHTDTWEESVALVKGQNADMFSAITQTAQREKYLHFTTNDIFSYPAVFLTHFDDTTVYLDIKNDCKNKKIGIVQGSGLGQYIKEKYPELNYVSITSTQEGFESLMENEIDLFAINTITARHYIENHHFHKIKIAMKLDYIYRLKIAVHKNLSKHIISILDKSLENISDDEINNIFNKWTQITTHKQTDWLPIVVILSGLLLAILFLVLRYRKFHLLMYNLLYSKHQAQIEENKRLLEENKQFISDMVHQIRTPLSVIMTNSSLIEMQTKEQVSPYITQINSAINMLSNSYEDLSYIISHDSITYKPIKINLTEFLHERIDFFEVIAEANQKTISTDIANDIELVMNDTELERLIDNNLSNAIKHGGDKTEIKIILEKKDSEIILQFISKGKSIKEVSKVFDKDYTESYTAKRSLGLGLSMVKDICEKNNIYYDVHSEDGTNTFTYFFKI